MNTELERILGDVADDAGHRAAALPVESLRQRGVRRRRTRQAGYGVIGVAAAFGLVLGTAQLLPDDPAPGPAAPSPVDWPTADPALPLGACGSVATNLPLTDSAVWLELSDEEVVAPVGAKAPAAVTVQNFGAEPLDLSRGEGPYLFVVRDGVVVGFSWPQSPPPSTVVEEEVFDDLGPFVLCEQGELRPSGDAAALPPLPQGQYTIHTAITLRPDSERTDPQFDWTFDLLGRTGTLTVIATAEPEVSPGPPSAVDVALPVCGEPTADWQFPTGVVVDPDMGLDVTVGHTGEDEGGGQTFFRAGYGDQLEVTFDYVNQVAEWGHAREVATRAVVVRDGVVVAELSFPEWRETEWTLWPLGETRAFSPVADWVDCASQQHTAVPKGDYEILGWRTIEVTGDDGSTGSLTIGYGAAPFTAYDFEDPDNRGPEG